MLRGHLNLYREEMMFLGPIGRERRNGWDTLVQEDINSL